MLLLLQLMNTNVLLNVEEVVYALKSSSVLVQLVLFSLMLGPRGRRRWFVRKWQGGLLLK